MQRRDNVSTERVPLLQAAKELGIAPQGLREYMKRGLIDLGLVMPSLDGKRYSYLIYRDKLNQVLGKGLPKEETL
jgi:predicted transcriptional regulator